MTVASHSRIAQVSKWLASAMLGYPALPWESGLVFGPSASFAHGVHVDAETCWHLHRELNPALRFWRPTRYRYTIQMQGITRDDARDDPLKSAPNANAAPISRAARYYQLAILAIVPRCLSIAGMSSDCVKTFTQPLDMAVPCCNAAA